MADGSGSARHHFRPARRGKARGRDGPPRCRLREALRRCGARVEAAPPSAGSVLAFDFGEKRIGVAIGDFALRIAHPLRTIAAEDNATRFAEIGALVNEWRPVQLVVGLPMHADGTEHEMSRLARRFAHRLEGRFSLPVALVDERLTSKAAESRLREAGVRGDRIEASLDAAAAGEILAAYFATP